MRCALICFLAVSLAGCFLLTRREEVAFLQGLAESQGRMQAQIETEQRIFNKLISDIKDNRLNRGAPKDEVFSYYGQPLFCRPAQQEPFEESCLYRNPAGVILAYLYFDEEQNLSDWKMIKLE